LREEGVCALAVIVESVVDGRERETHCYAEEESREDHDVSIGCGCVPGTERAVDDKGEGGEEDGTE
jgi:hypothetical protein